MTVRSLALALTALAAVACTKSEQPAHAAHAAQKAPASAAKPEADGTILVRATRDGFEPSRIEVEGGKPVTLVFLREVEKTCMTGVVFPDLGIEKDLPLGERVEVQVTPQAGGTIRFQCPMGMGKSTIVALPRS